MVLHLEKVIPMFYRYLHDGIYRTTYCTIKMNVELEIAIENITLLYTQMQRIMAGTNIVFDQTLPVTIYQYAWVTITLLIPML